MTTDRLAKRREYICTGYRELYRDGHQIHAHHCCQSVGHDGLCHCATCDLPFDPYPAKGRRKEIETNDTP